MKKAIKLLVPFALLIPSFFSFYKESTVAKATSNRPEYNIPLLSGESFDYGNAIFDDFDNGVDPDSWWINHRQWANSEQKNRRNGGVVPENVFYDASKGTILLRTAGDYYAEKEISTPSGALATEGRRSGGDLVSKFLTYPGRYEVRMKVAPRYGVCTTMWTYIEYGGYISSIDGRHNHEIDIELPYDGNFKKISFGNYTGGFDSMHSSEKVLIDNPLNDGEFHTFGFDWYYNETLNHKVIRYYIDGEILSVIDEDVPFYKTKVNIGIWVPDSKLAGTPPRYDQAYAEIDYFKYIPFLNNKHEDATAYKIVDDQEVPTDPYEFKTGASIEDYPSVSTPSIKQNYFPNGTFNYVKKLNSSLWIDASRTGIENSNVTIAKTTYDYESSSNSGGASIGYDGYLAGYIDSCFKGQKYNLSFNYRYQGFVRVKSFNANDEVISTLRFDLDPSSSWTSFSEDITLTDNDVTYISVSIHNDSVNALWVDNIYLLLGEKESTGPEEISSSKNHFMAMLHDNPQVLSAFNTTSWTAGSRKNNIIISGMDYTSDIAWKVSTARYEVKNSDYINSVTIGSSSNQLDTSIDENYLGMYNAANSVVGLNGYQAAMYSTTEVEDLHDISLAWNSADCGKVIVCYKLHGASWQYLANYSVSNTNDGSNVKESFNRRQLIINADDETFATTLFGKSAQIGFLYSDQKGGTADMCYMRLQAIIINKINSIKAKINYWSENNTNLCGTSGTLFTDKSQEKFDLLMTNYRFNITEANELNTAIEVVGSAKEATYYQQYNFLCAKAGITPNAVPSELYQNYLSFNGEGVNLTVVIMSIIAITGLTLIITKTKKKQG